MQEKQEEPTVQLGPEVTRLILPIVMRALARKERAEREQLEQERALASAQLND